jgi:GTP-binding protein HflX
MTPFDFYGFNFRLLEDFRSRADTLEIEHAGFSYQKKESPEAGTVLGKGKLKEIAEEAKRNNCDTLVFDFELSGSQVRNIKKLTELEVIDRVSIILEIFAQHAKTRDSKIQIEILRLEYLLPRLSTLWTHFSRQKGGIGLRGGEGEQQIELDRRMIRDRVAVLKKELAEIQKSRSEQKKKRQNQAVTAALVGYTNAGKSTLMNKMCKVDVLAEDKLFATLDSTFRMLNPDTKPPMILVDTVGFISNLPSTLVQGFKTTLESALEADLLIIVCDISDPNFEKHLKVTNEVLEELEVGEKPRLIVFNKKDKLDNPYQAMIKARTYPNHFIVSAQDADEIEDLRSSIINHFLDLQDDYELFVPYERGDLHSKIIGKTNVLSTKHHEDGTFYKIKIPDFLFNSLGLSEFLTSPKEEKKQKIKLVKTRKKFI